MLGRSLLAAGLLGATALSIASAAALGPLPGLEAGERIVMRAQIPGFGPCPGSLKFKGGGSRPAPYVGTLKPPPGGYKFKGGGPGPAPYVGTLKPPPGGYKFKRSAKDQGSSRRDGMAHRGNPRRCRPISRPVFFESCWWRRVRCEGAVVGPASVRFACLSCPDLPGRRCPGGS